LDRCGDERCVEEILRVPLDQYGHIPQLWVSTPIEPSLGEKRENVPEDLGDPPSGSKLGNEVRFIAHDLKRVRSPQRNCHLASSLYDSRFAQTLADAERAVAYEKPFLLAQVAVKRPSVAPATRLEARSGQWCSRGGRMSHPVTARCLKPLARRTPTDLVVLDAQRRAGACPA
jgi:hypothetical protein